MAVNALMTGLIVFKILKVFLEFKPTSVERTLGSLSSTGGSKLRHIIFIIIESGMALFAIQLVRVVLTSLVAQTESLSSLGRGLVWN
jgi:TRAP-type mannitol/chloroaromatic compound transport system permease small subunit